MIQLHFEFIVGLQEVLNNGERIGNTLKIAKGQLELYVFTGGKLIF